MDPDVALANMRASIRAAREAAAIVDLDLANDEALTAIDYAEALDEWIDKGGFLPAAWTNPSDAITLWQVTAHVTYLQDGWSSSLHLPTFVMNAEIQGIVGEPHAKSIVTDMLERLVRIGGGNVTDLEFHVTAVPIKVKLVTG